ncbi:radical SAM family heme chaperone HemW [Oscillatoria sp. FACHB-1406]|uniref:radical SAM family heme chaperone HemW n=1 Tax=Oscillatoria sp. FACHB-1406 TaxID=2692846 RepID=UPI001686629B|nr:radical SAM family heme chaperone HemW [Oscillatoria sp. FACHB-1406]MBD2580408.1 coproporphyrinogen III oxidase [Oscillatoria sp. FACHB-1406]
MEMVRSAYVHIPFCRRRCYYCDFPISVVGDNAKGETSGTIAQYVEFLCREIATTPSGESLETVFFGGGTPSLLSPGQLSQILTDLDSRFGLSAACEISMEMDPGTFRSTQIEEYVKAGVTRVSLGAQAFQDELLERCGRTHRVRDILEAIAWLHRAGVKNISLDLISGLPGQTPEQWQDSLRDAIALSPQHLSCYDLVLEPVTAFGKQFQPGETPLPSDEATAQMYRTASKTLRRAGYEHYEISNYARPGFQCRHNRVYWENRPYYGFGMGAASYTQGQRFTRPRTRREYYAWVEGGCRVEVPPTTAREALLETLMLGLRLAEGVSLREICDRFGEAARDRIVTTLQRYESSGWVARDRENLRLSDPEGFLFSNTILAELFQAFES